MYDSGVVIIVRFECYSKNSFIILGLFDQTTRALVQMRLLAKSADPLRPLLEAHGVAPNALLCYVEPEYSQVMSSKCKSFILWRVCGIVCYRYPLAFDCYDV